MREMPRWSPTLKTQLDNILTAPARPPETMNFMQLDGFVRAITLLPEFNLVANYATDIFGGEDPNYKDLKEASQFLQALFALSNTHTEEILSRKCSFPCDTSYHKSAEKRVNIENWCQGFLMGFSASEDLWCDYLEFYPDAEADTTLTLEPLPEQLDAILYIVETIADSETAVKEGTSPDDLDGIFDCLEESIIICGLISQALIDAENEALGSNYPELTDEELLFEEPQILPFVRSNKKIGRNDPCPCGSGKKFKKCCLH
ncbi:MAG TPA: YecA family protein [Aeromonadales bacterium]|nr:YecA family protein [Aeromonadales bacterium]